MGRCLWGSSRLRGQRSLGPWSETTYLEPRREGLLHGSTGLAPWSLVPLLWLPCVVRRRRREIRRGQGIL